MLLPDQLVPFRCLCFPVTSTYIEQLLHNALLYGLHLLCCQLLVCVRCCTGPEDQKVLLVSLPRFASSGTLVLVNLKTLAVHPIQFDADISA